MFQVSKLTDRIYKIQDYAGTYLYLIIGEKKAALIDTGVGIGSLKEVVEKITDKPVIVLLSHGHVDHAMGSVEFDTVYCNPNDRQVYNEQKSVEERKKHYANAFIYPPREKEKLDDSVYLPTKDFKDFLPLNPGDVFDLGGIHLEIFDAKGHTQGSVAILIKEERILYLGDACNRYTWVWTPYSSTIQDYKDSLIRLNENTKGKYDRTIFAHGNGDGELHIIDNVISIADEILEGRDMKIPFNKPGFSNNDEIFIAHKPVFDMRDPSAGFGNIVYNKNKIR